MGARVLRTGFEWVAHTGCTDITIQHTEKNQMVGGSLARSMSWQGLIGPRSLCPITLSSVIPLICVDAFDV